MKRYMYISVVVRIRKTSQISMVIIVGAYNRHDWNHFNGRVSLLFASSLRKLVQMQVQLSLWNAV